MFDYIERRELIRCEMCEGQRILVDICGESVCGWCDGSGVQLADVVTLLETGQRPLLED